MSLNMTLNEPVKLETVSPAQNMRAAVITGPGELRIETVPLPEPATGQVRVRLEGCGVCASNLVPWAGPEWMQFPTEPGGLGHEGWGTIDAIGPDVESTRVGERVAALFYHSYAEFDVGDADAVVRIPPDMGDRPFPGEPLGCAMNIFHRSNIEPGQVVAIVGVGFIGAMLCRLMAESGAHVIAISRRRFALDMAKRMGASELIELDDHYSIIDRVKALTNGVFCDRVIEATGKQGPLDLATEITRERGRLVIAGYHQDGLRQVNMQLWNWRGLDVINAHERDRAVYIQGMRDAIKAMASGKFDPLPLYTHRFPLSHLDDALNATRDRPDGFMKALVMMQ